MKTKLINYTGSTELAGLRMVLRVTAGYWGESVLLDYRQKGAYASYTRTEKFDIFCRN